MAVSVRHLLHQGPTLAALAKIAISTGAGSDDELEAPGPELERTITPPAPALVRDYVAHVGGNPSAYRDTVPHHLFSQWAFPLMSEGLRGLPYDVRKVINAGCSLEMRAPLPQGQPWRVALRLEEIEVRDSIVLLTQRITTGPLDTPEALVASVNILIPRPRKDGAKRAKRPPVVVPADARELDYWKLSARAGRDFALLTGDINPIHWIPLAARASGFKGCILHGFSTLARSIEALYQVRFSGRVDALQRVDARFARPVNLPGSVGLYVHDDQFWVGTAPGAPAALIGSTVPTETSS